MTTDESAQTGPEGRRQPRASLFLAAVMRAGLEQVPVKVRNMSLNGAMVDSPLTPPPGTDVQLVRGSLIAQGKVMWSSDNCCGLRFTSEVSIKDWLATPTKVEQQRVDAIVSLVKSGAMLSEFVGIDEASPDPQFDLQLAQGLRAAISLMEDLEDELSSSDETLARHSQKLQNLDIAMQTVRAVEQGLSAANKADDRRVRATLDSLRIICAQALGRD